MFENITEVTVPIDLGGPRKMVFNANTMVAFEKETGKMYLDTVTKLTAALFAPDTMNANPVSLADMHAARKRLEDGEITQEQLDEVKAGFNETVKLNNLRMTRVVTAIPMLDLRALLWSCLHEYNDKDIPYWPLTINQVGRMLTPNRIPDVFLLFIRGQMENMPSKETMGESQTVAKTSEQPTRSNGGTTSTVVPSSAFD